MIELNSVYCGDCAKILLEINDVSVDLTVTSPPYDTLRKYENNIDETWCKSVWRPVIKELYRVTKQGGVVVWVVGDAVIKGSETGSSFEQALYFMECGFNLHDTMIYEKNSSTFPARKNGNRYTQIFEYMFVLTKGKIKANLIIDKKNKWAGYQSFDGKIPTVPEYSPRTNIWKYTTSFGNKSGHPAVFPMNLATDHVLTWSNVGDLVLDPFCGSGTTLFAARNNGRKFIGIDISEKYVDYIKERMSDTFLV